ncbi:MAG: hypothetical protein WA001_04665 [Patescibacteria group bacterium]
MSGRTITPQGTSAQNGRGLSSLDVKRVIRAIFDEKTDLRALEIEFSKGEVLVQEGHIADLRCAFVVAEGVLLEQRTRYIPDRGGQVTKTLCTVRPGSIAFIQGLSPAHVGQAAKQTVIAESDGRAYMIETDWLQSLRKLDKDGVMLGHAIALQGQLLDALLEEQLAQHIDQDIREMAAFLLRENPNASITEVSLKQQIVRRLRSGKDAEDQLESAKASILALTEDIIAARTEISSLRALAAPKAHEAFKELQEDERQSRALVDLSNFFDGILRTKGVSLTATQVEQYRAHLREVHPKRPNGSSAQLLDGSIFPDLAESAPVAPTKDETMEVTDEEIVVELDTRDSASGLKPQPLPPLPRGRSKTLIGAEPYSHRIADERTQEGLGDVSGEDTLIGVIPAPPPPAKPLGMINPFGPPRKLAPATGGPFRSLTPGRMLRVSEIPKAPPPPIPPRRGVTMPGPLPILREESSPEIETEEVGHSQTANWGFAADLGTAPKK